MTMPELLVRIARVRRRMYDAENPKKRLRVSKELDDLLNYYYHLKLTPS